METRGKRENLIKPWKKGENKGCRDQRKLSNKKCGKQNE